MGYEVKRWRDVLPVHPAADLFPLMSESELRELGEDIKKNGLRSPITVYNGELLDGRNRLDAMVLAGIEIEIRLPHKGTLSFHRLDIDGIYAQQGVSELPPCTDPYAYVLSANIHRRHLTADQKRELIEKLLKVKPNASDRTIAKQTKVDNKTVAKVRAKLVGREEIPHVEKRTDTRGRKQPSAKPKATVSLNGQQIDVAKLGQNAQAVIDIETGRTQMAELDHSGVCDLDKLKQQLTETIEQQIALIIQERTLVERANLTPTQASEIKTLLDELGDKHQAVIDEGTAYDVVHKIVSDDDNRKRLANEAKNPDKALNAARKQCQRDDMECDRDEAKQQARESGDSWSEMKDDWERDWIESNWNEEQFQNEYKEDWKRDHGQEFPNSNFAQP